MFRFKDQFKRYNRPFIAIEESSDGYYDPETGKYIPPSEPREIEMQGIIAQVGDDDLRHDEGGTLTFEDKKIIVDTDHYRLKYGQEVIIEGEKYKVFQIASHSLYSHFQKVYAKRVSTND